MSAETAGQIQVGLGAEKRGGVDRKIYWSRHRAGRRFKLIASSNPTPARYRWRPCGVAWIMMPSRTLMVEYINKGIILFYFINQSPGCRQGTILAPVTAAW